MRPAAHFQAARKVAVDIFDAFPLAGRGRIGFLPGIGVGIVLATINEDMYRFVEGKPQPDDITMLVVRHRKDSPLE